MMKHTNGVELWRGPSVLDGEDVVVLASGILNASRNTKTGPLVQLYILRADMPPAEALRTDADASICGTCPLRGILDAGTASGRSQRGCYVWVGQGPTQVYKAWASGGYPRRDVKVLTGRKLRIGAYGDPAAVPVEFWREVTDYARGWTSYTHMWRDHDLSEFCMASVETEAEAEEAHALGYRTYRTGETGVDGEILCPAVDPDVPHMTCYDCGLCDGSGTAKSIYAPAHGSGKNHVKRLNAA